jgi:hypothetical protein
MRSGATGKTARVNRPGSSTGTQGRSPVGVKMNRRSFGRWVITPRSPVTESWNNICAEPGGVGCGVVIPTGDGPSCIARHRNRAAVYLWERARSGVRRSGGCRTTTAFGVAPDTPQSCHQGRLCWSAHCDVSWQIHCNLPRTPLLGSKLPPVRHPPGAAPISTDRSPAHTGPFGAPPAPHRGSSVTLVPWGHPTGPEQGELTSKPGYRGAHSQAALA